MSSDPIGGYIFFSGLSGRQSLIELTIRTMELELSDIKHIWVTGENENDDRDLVSLPWEQAVSALASAPDGLFHAHTLDRSESYGFDPPLGLYQTVMINCFPGELSGKSNPGGGDRLSRRWLALCEEGNADFGFFGQFSQMPEIEYRDAQFLALEHKDVVTLMEEWSSYWLIYLGPELATRWRASQKSIEAYEQRWLPSGAFFVRAHTDVYSYKA